jgi:4a-hydroxytetrahydrobiopterin dehydratase
MALIAPDEVKRRIKELPGWSAENAAIRRQFTFPSFPDALAFVVRVGFVAESADHHPDLAISYKKVTVTYSTHSEGGVTAKDFAGAQSADDIARSLGGK